MSEYKCKCEACKQEFTLDHFNIISVQPLTRMGGLDWIPVNLQCKVTNRLHASTIPASIAGRLGIKVPKRKL